MSTQFWNPPRCATPTTEDKAWSSPVACHNVFGMSSRSCFPKLMCSWASIRSPRSQIWCRTPWFVGRPSSRSRRPNPAARPVENEQRKLSIASPQPAPKPKRVKASVEPKNSAIPKRSWCQLLRHPRARLLMSISGPITFPTTPPPDFA